MKNFSLKILAILTLFLCLGGCETFELNDSSDIVTGRWSSNVAPVSGDCCHLDLTLDSDDGKVTGSGVVETPGQRIGVSEEFTIQVTGTVIDERIRMTLASTNNPGLIEGFVDREFSATSDLVMRVNFEGFGFEGRDIVLFRRSTR